MPDGERAGFPWEQPAGAAPPPPVGQAAPVPPQWTPPTAPVQAQWPAPDWTPPPPPPRRSRRRRIALLALVAGLVAAGLTAGGLVLFGSSSPALTFQGKHIDHPERVLAATETKVRATVHDRHGALDNNTRCYFARPKQPAAGANKNDVDTALRCGPVLFVDGDTGRTFLSYTLSAANSGGSVTLTAADNPSSDEPAAVPTTVDLVRPDRKAAPRTNTLSVPQPPPAAKNALLADDLGKVASPKQLDTAFMVSLNTGVKLIAVGIVPRYGQGDDARSAPPGEELIAFQTVDEPGEQAEQPSNGSLTLSDANGSRPVPLAPASDQWDIVAEPAGATPRLVLKDGGYTQTITLPSGNLGASNLAVLTRSNRLESTQRNGDVGVSFSDANGSASTTFHATLYGAKLDFWFLGNIKQHASKPGDALLFVHMNYTDPQAPGGPYGFDPGFLTLKMPNGVIVHARNLAPDPNKVADVFEVPATFTSGTVVVTGSFVQDGVTATVTAPASFPVSFAAG